MSKYKQRQQWPGQPFSYHPCHCTSPCSPDTSLTDTTTEKLKRQRSILTRQCVQLLNVTYFIPSKCLGLDNGSHQIKSRVKIRGEIFVLCRVSVCVCMYADVCLDQECVCVLIPQVRSSGLMEVISCPWRDWGYEHLVFLTTMLLSLIQRSSHRRLQSHSR